MSCNYLQIVPILVYHFTWCSYSEQTSIEELVLISFEYDLLFLIFVDNCKNIDI